MKWGTSDLVDIHPTLIRLAIAFRAASISRLASAIGDPRQTIHTMCKGDKKKRCHSWRRAAIARRLGVSEHVLSGKFGTDELMRELESVK